MSTHQQMASHYGNDQKKQLQQWAIRALHLILLKPIKNQLATKTYKLAYSAGPNGML
ncbi:hypothetical protein PRVXH_001288 [Proteinivorax hydrogeniformans]|uniref:Uncharacterized protein n=1 Tax=Proteinivorax hydrogeniformans TaxID=1826727 RepID=A0AAU8HX39_9FIRM